MRRRLHYDRPQHEPDYGEDHKSGLAAGEVLVVLGQSAAAPEPAEGSLDNPPLRTTLKPLASSDRLTISSGIPAAAWTSAAV
jgi:hypothetical protein